MSTKTEIKKNSKSRQNIEKTEPVEWMGIEIEYSFDFGSIQSENDKKEECSRCLFGKKRI